MTSRCIFIVDVDVASRGERRTAACYPRSLLDFEWLTGTCADAADVRPLSERTWTNRGTDRVAYFLSLSPTLPRQTLESCATRVYSIGSECLSSRTIGTFKSGLNSFFCSIFRLRESIADYVRWRAFSTEFFKWLCEHFFHQWYWILNERHDNLTGVVFHLVLQIQVRNLSLVAIRNLTLTYFLMIFDHNEITMALWWWP